MSCIVKSSQSQSTSILRLTVSWPVCLGVRHPSGTRYQFYLLLLFLLLLSSSSFLDSCRAELRYDLRPVSQYVFVPSSPWACDQTLFPVSAFLL
jgi:hypothetical protein